MPQCFSETMPLKDITSAYERKKKTESTNNRYLFRNFAFETGTFGRNVITLLMGTHLSCFSLRLILAYFEFGICAEILFLRYYIKIRKNSI
jgi:hypothetical protein